MPHEFVENATFQLNQDVLNASYPWDPELKGWSQCLSLDLLGAANGTVTERSIGGSAARKWINCKEYVYDRSVYKSTTTSEVQNSNYLSRSCPSIFFFFDANCCN